MTEVVLVASGYEWRCPDCGEAGYEAGVPSNGRVFCTACGGSFTVAATHHRDNKGPISPRQALSSQASFPFITLKSENGNKPVP